MPPTPSPSLICSGKPESLEPVNSHTAALTDPQVVKLRQILDERGFSFVEKEHALFSAHKGRLNVTVYKKGPKVLIQGKETEDFIRFILEPEVLGEAKIGYEEILQPDMFQPHFGIDESGKGDYFGPLVVAGVYTDADITRRLMNAGIMDSKRISSPARIRKLADAIRNTPGCVWEMVSLGPERYNEMMGTFHNVNRLLAWGHARVIGKLARMKPACPRALSDQFASNPDVLQRALNQNHIDITLEQRTKGESDIAVAAASILARERFIDWMDKSSHAGGVPLPLGASEAVVHAARELIGRHGPSILEKTAKLHFRTTAAVLGAPPTTGEAPPQPER